MSSRIGMLSLSHRLVNHTSDILSSSLVKSTLRTDVDKLFFYSWKETQRGREKDNIDEPAAIVRYGSRESAAYTVSDMPRSYAAISSILSPLKPRFSGVTSMTDFACGPGTAVWAALDSGIPIASAVAVDTSQSMLDLVSDFSTLYPSTIVSCKRYMDRTPDQMVVAAFALSQMGQAVRRDTVARLWEKTGEYLLVIEKGTPDGFGIVREVRDWVIDRSDGRIVAPVSPAVITI